MYTLSLILLSLTLSAQPNSSTGSSNITQAIASVGETVLTSREAKIVAALDFMLKHEDSTHLNIPQEESKEFKEAVAQYVTVSVVNKEAQTYQLANLEEQDYKVQLQKINAQIRKIKNLNEWQKLEVTTVELENFLKLKMRADKFLKFKRDSSLVMVSEEEALNYFKANRTRFGSSPFTQFKESIRSFLSQERAEERLKSWFQVLQKKYKVRNQLAD